MLYQLSYSRRGPYSPCLRPAGQSKSAARKSSAVKLFKLQNRLLMRGALTLLLSAAIFLRPGAVLAKPRVLVVTGNLKIYLDTAKQLPRYFDAAYTQADTSQARAHLSQGKFEAVVAIGQEAAELAMAAEKQKPVFFALAVHIEKLNLRQPNAAGVDINASLATQLERIKKPCPAPGAWGCWTTLPPIPKKWGRCSRWQRRKAYRPSRALWPLPAKCPSAPSGC